MIKASSSRKLSKYVAGLGAPLAVQLDTPPGARTPACVLWGVYWTLHPAPSLGLPCIELHSAAGVYVQYIIRARRPLFGPKFCDQRAVNAASCANKHYTSRRLVWFRKLTPMQFRNRPYIGEVTRRRARLVLGWVTWRTSSVCCRPPRPTQPPPLHGT